MIESGCAELLGGAHDRCVQVCRMKTVDLLVAKHMNQFKVVDCVLVSLLVCSVDGCSWGC